MHAKLPASNWIDPDDAPELTEEWFKTATYHVGDKAVTRAEFKAAAAKRGRPLGSVKANPKQQATLRFDPEVLAPSVPPGVAGRRVLTKCCAIGSRRIRQGRWAERLAAGRWRLTDFAKTRCTLRRLPAPLFFSCKVTYNPPPFNKRSIANE